MNERIKQLLEQTGIHFYKRSVLDKHYPELYDGVYCELTVEEIEKLAELIVNECIESGNDLAKHYINNHSEQEQAPLLAAIADYSNEIKKHFGVA